MKGVFRFLLIFLIAACRSPLPEEEPQYRVVTEAEPYVRAFAEEAQKRGKTISLSNLIVEFGPVEERDVCGECRLATGQTPRIFLMKNATCWTGASVQARECLVFHELGHCLFHRAHKNNTFPNGAYVSLMNRNDVAVYATCLYDIGGDVCDKRSRREYYLDELFDESTPVPAWGK